MTINEQENLHLIENFVTLKREIALERDAQLATIARVIGRDADLIIEKLRLLNKYEKEAKANGKVNPRTTEEAHTTTVHIQEPRHSTMLMRTIPD